MRLHLPSVTHTTGQGGRCPQASGLWIGALAACWAVACGARVDPFEVTDAGVCPPEDASVDATDGSMSY